MTAARTAVAGAAATLAAIALAGCTAALPEQQAARDAVETHLLGLTGYDGDVHCTRNPRPWFVERAASVYLCAARRDDGDCDWFRVTVDRTVAVRLDQERGGCVLPA